MNSLLTGGACIVLGRAHLQSLTGPSLRSGGDRRVPAQVTSIMRTMIGAELTTNTGAAQWSTHSPLTILRS
jgi:hypothetical protein